MKNYILLLFINHIPVNKLFEAFFNKTKYFEILFEAFFNKNKYIEILFF
jgi:hypothetical protein